MTENPLIASLEAERSVLGAIVLPGGPAGVEAYNQAAALLAEDGSDFAIDSHRHIWRCIGRMIDQGVSVDQVTLYVELDRSNEAEVVGGAVYISSLTDGLPKLSNIEHYVRIVKDYSVRRKLAHASNEALQKANVGSEDTETILGRHTDQILALAAGASKSGPVLLSEYLNAEYPTVDSIHERARRKPGLLTGFLGFDQLTAGLRAANLIYLAARPSMGKTSFALDVLRFVALVLNLPVFFCSLEMSREEVVTRLICAEARVNSKRLTGGTLSQEEWHRVACARKRLASGIILIDDSADLTLGRLRAYARRFKQEHGLALLLVDYLQLMHAPRAENRNQEISALSRGLKIAAKELDVPLVALSQLSRAPEQRQDHRPQLSDLRDSGSLEQDGDLICFLHREEYYLGDDKKAIPPNLAGTAELIIRKQRNGPVGTVPLVFNGEWASFAGFTTGGAEL